MACLSALNKQAKQAHAVVWQQKSKCCKLVKNVLIWIIYDGKDIINLS